MVTAEKSAATQANDPNFLFRNLVDRLKGKPPEYQQRVTAHIKEVSGHTSIPTYHNNGASDEEKADVYRACLKAVLTGDFTALRQPAATTVINVAGATESVQVVPTPQPEAKRPAPVKPAPNPPAKAQGTAEEALAVLSAAMSAFQQQSVKPAEVDPEEVRRIAAEVVKEALDAFKVPEAPAHRIEFATTNGVYKSLDGLVHPQVTQVACWLKAGVPVWLHSAAGSGKTHMARQIAALLDVEPYVMSVDPTLTVGKIMGYRNVANGEFVEGFAYKPFKDGGLLVADEKDTGDAGVMASANAMLSNLHYMFPNGATVDRNAQFYYLALANTKGMGAVAGYTARNRLDAATLDRVAIIECKYDEGMEMAASCGIGKPGTPWLPGKPASQDQQRRFVEWVQEVRKFVGTSVLVSPRASINGCKALRAGIPASEVADALVFKLCAEDTIQRIKARHPVPQ